jgi:hypothetical protein
VGGAIVQPGMEIEPSLKTASLDVELGMQPVSTEWIEDGLAGNDPPRRVKAQYLKDRLAHGEKLETSYAGPFSAVKLGELLFIAMSGEPVVAWSHRFRRKFAPGQVWVAGYCNDMYGYLPTRQIQVEGGYEGGRANLWSALPAPWTDDIEGRIDAAISRLVKQINQE